MSISIASKRLAFTWKPDTYPYVYGHRNERKTRIHRKIRHCTSFFIHFLFRCTKFTVSLYVVLLRKIAAIIAMLTVHAATNKRANIRHSANLSISWLIVLYIAVRFYNANRTIYLYFLALLMPDHWDPACHSVWSSAIHWFHVHMTAVWFRPVRRAIAQDDNPPSW